MALVIKALEIYAFELNIEKMKPLLKVKYWSNSQDHGEIITVRDSLRLALILAVQIKLEKYTVAGFEGYLFDSVRPSGCWKSTHLSRMEDVLERLLNTLNIGKEDFKLKESQMDDDITKFYIVNEQYAAAFSDLRILVSESPATGLVINSQEKSWR